MNSPDHELLTIDQFKRLLRETFQLTAGDTSLEVELIEVTSRRLPGALEPAGWREPFALIFWDPQASLDCFLPQGTYSFSHAELPATEIFVVPVGPSSSNGGICYEATFT